MKRVCYLISHGFAARMLLHSSLVEELNRCNIEVVVLSEESSGSAFGRDASNSSLKFVKADFVTSPYRHNQVAEMRRYFRGAIENNAALWARHLSFINSTKMRVRVRARVMLLINRIARRNRLFVDVFASVDSRLHRSRKLRSQLKAMGVDAVVSTYPVSSFETSCILEAQKIGIETIGHILSWDNICSKGHFPAVPKRFIAWGPIMKQELMQEYGIPEEDISECGVPHFDQHHTLCDSNVRDRELCGIGLNPMKPYLFFGMSAPFFAPHEIDIVEWLAQQVENNEFGTDMQLVVRPHPQNVSGNMADPRWLPRLNALRSARVGLNIPRICDSKLAWNMDQEDLAVIVNILNGCAICLNSGSTLSIDALHHGKPVVLTMFDGEYSLPWWGSARRLREFPHYEKLLRTKALRVANDFEGLKELVLLYLKNPDMDSSFRDEALRLECGDRSRNASKRVAESIARFVS